MAANEQKAGFMEYAGSLGFHVPHLDRYYEALKRGEAEKLVLSNLERKFDGQAFTYELYFGNREGEPALTGFRATTLLLPGLAHDMHEGIATAGLELFMGFIRWRHPPEADSPGLEQQIVNDLDRLTNSSVAQARQIADVLKARYWTGTRMDGQVDHDRIKALYERSCYFGLEGTDSDITAKEAASLLSGRYMLKRYMPHWIGVVPANPGDQTTCRLKEYPDLPLGDHLRRLPLKELSDEASIIGMLLKMFRGEQVRATLVAKNGSYQVFLVADPKEKTVSVLNPLGRPVNLEKLLGPDRAKGHLQQQSGSPKKRGRNKGPSL
ncbi:hypothetical protein VRU48_14815 [Pedobacter sp. KR3-3]|uniref:Uncharacterized protein n=1 Tax=Pedobacter albus TaxID=3113905 RepID=A0ABU7IA90_9SPHI|nr:hypothetical protein [Pedobacter sp. KR3-3]MEE1946393.1 hypothetical protein [Pedobacter sp. KR3-3]